MNKNFVHQVGDQARLFKTFLTMPSKFAANKVYKTLQYFLRQTCMLLSSECFHLRQGKFKAKAISDPVVQHTRNKGNLTL
jgi:hypothetical protein